jgi:hypothetical protein
MNATDGPYRAAGFDRSRAIAELAYHFWEKRGCPEGSPEKDWYKAELVIDREQDPEASSLAGSRGRDVRIRTTKLRSPTK